MQATSFMVFFDWDRSNLSAQAESTISSGGQRLQDHRLRPRDRDGPHRPFRPGELQHGASLRRANTVKDPLVRNGVPATAISVIGKGESQPLVQTADGVREPQNRRVEIVIDGVQAAKPAVFSIRSPTARHQATSGATYRTSQVDTVTAAAMAKCEAGNYAEGIPVLEENLIGAKIPPPAPGYRWPGRPATPA